MDFKKIEKKWQEKWEKSKIFLVKKAKEKKYYVLEMYPYPSGSGLHMGHAFNYTIGDVQARFKRMQGLNVLYPMGYDSFGLPAENAAIKAGEHPKKYTDNAIKNFINQQRKLGLSYDWSRLLMSHDPDYYRWNQYFFLKFLENDLVYRKKAPVNWCPECNTVLANEQVHQGKCWRHEDTEVKTKQLEQWFIRTTKYADELLDMIDKLEWPERIKIMQKNWIGKSYGSEIDFEIVKEGRTSGKWKIFTTRPDTIFGVTFMVVSAQHEKLMDLVTKDQKKEVEQFLRKVKTMDKNKLEKEGVFTGSYAINPINDEKIPVWTGNFVVADYGSGMVMAVPAHDQRDFEFAKKYNLPIRVVVQPSGEKLSNERAYVDRGNLVNSGQFNGFDFVKAKEEITKYLSKKRLGRFAFSYKLKDWLVSRQRYWGTPIPIVYCDKCGIVPVSEKDLPVKLPENVSFGKGNPLETSKSFVETKCPKCNRKARRETDTMDTFFDSSWYYLRYCDNKNSKKPFDSEKIKYWMSVDQYIGGAEHACMHLIYARFFTKALRDLKFLKFDEPFIKLFNQGMIHGSDGFVMSKSRGNVIEPLRIIEKYGADSLRLFLISVASPDKDFNWSDKGIEGSFKFVKKVFDYFNRVKIGKADDRIESKLNKTIKEVTDYVEDFNYNIAIIKIRDLFDSLPDKISKEVLRKSLKLLHIFCPHITEELWNKLGSKKFISLESWPKADEKKIDKKFEKQEQAIEKLKNDINNIKNIINNKNPKVYIYVLPKDFDFYKEIIEHLSKQLKLEVKVFVNNDAKKYDPMNKASKAKFGRPSIYLE